MFRILIIGLAAALGAAPATEAAAPQMRKQAPGFFRMMLGALEVTALSDGTHAFPVYSAMTAKAGTERRLLPDARPGEAEARLAEAGLSLPFEGSINAFLVNDGRRLMLFDSGAGPLYGACCGRLKANLEAAGYRADQVDDVWLTHLHADHVGGLARDGQASFPKATVHVSRQDVDYWLDPEKERAAPAFLAPMFEGARLSLAPYIASGRLALFDGEGDVAPDVHALPTPGHTRGHTSYRVTSGAETLLIWGDVVHVAPIQFPDPGVAVTYDNDPEAAVAQREKLFFMASRAGVWIAAAHVAFPGLGHVLARDGHFSWSPANYNARTDQPGEAGPPR